MCELHGYMNKLSMTKILFFNDLDEFGLASNISDGVCLGKVGIITTDFHVVD